MHNKECNNSLKDFIKIYADFIHLNWQLVSTWENNHARGSTWNSWSEHDVNFQNVILHLL